MGNSAGSIRGLGIFVELSLLCGPSTNFWAIEMSVRKGFHNDLLASDKNAITTKNAPSTTASDRSVSVHMDHHGMNGISCKPAHTVTELASARQPPAPVHGSWTSTPAVLIRTISPRALVECSSRENPRPQYSREWPAALFWPWRGLATHPRQ